MYGKFLYIVAGGESERGGGERKWMDEMTESKAPIFRMKSSPFSWAWEGRPKVISPPGCMNEHAFIRTLGYYLGNHEGYPILFPDFVAIDAGKRFI